MAPLLAPIFRSDGQARLLSTLLLTGDELSVTDLAKQAGLAYQTVHREVARLVDAGILTERQVGRTRLIRANDESPLVDPLREILTVATGPRPWPRNSSASAGSSRRSSRALSPGIPVRHRTTWITCAAVRRSR